MNMSVRLGLSLFEQGLVLVVFIPVTSENMGRVKHCEGTQTYLPYFRLLGPTKWTLKVVGSSLFMQLRGPKINSIHGTIFDILKPLEGVGVGLQVNVDGVEKWFPFPAKMIYRFDTAEGVRCHLYNRDRKCRNDR